MSFNGISWNFLSPSTATTYGLYYFKAIILVTFSHLAAKKSNSALENKSNGRLSHFYPAPLWVATGLSAVSNSKHNQRNTVMRDDLRSGAGQQDLRLHTYLKTTIEGAASGLSFNLLYTAWPIGIVHITPIQVELTVRK